MDENAQDLEINWHQSKVDYEQQIHRLEAQLLKQTEQLTDSEVKLDRAIQRTKKLEDDNERLRCDLSTAKEDADKARILSSHTQTISDLQTELASKDNEITVYAQKLRDLQQSNLTLEDTALKHQSAALGTDYRFQSLQAELDHQKKETADLHSQLDSVSDQLRSERVKYTETVSDLSHKLQLKHADLERTLRDLEASNASSSAFKLQIDKLQQALLEAASNFTETRENLEGELESQRKLSELYQHALKEEQNRSAGLEEELEDLANALENANSTLEQSRSESKDLSDTVKSLQSDLETLKQMPRLELDAVRDINDLSKTDVYARYTSAMHMLQKEQAETKRLEEYMRRIKLEVNAKAPAVQQQREEYQRLSIAFRELEMRYCKNVDELNVLRSENERLNGRVKDTESELKTVNRDYEEVSRQLRNVLEQRQRSDTEQGTLELHYARNLVPFSNVAELLHQNERLRSFTKELLQVNTQLQENTDSEELALLEQRYKEQTLRIEQLEQNQLVTVENSTLASHSPSLKDQNSSQVMDQVALSSPNDHDLHQQWLDERSDLVSRLDESSSLSRRLQSDCERLKLQLSFSDEKLQLLETQLKQSQRDTQMLQSKNDILINSLGALEKSIERKENMVQQLATDKTQLQIAQNGLETTLSMLRTAESRLLSQIDTLSAENQNKQRMLDKISQTPPHTVSDSLLSQLREDLQGAKEESAKWLNQLEHERHIRSKMVKEHADTVEKLKQHCMDTETRLQSAIDALKQEKSSIEIPSISSTEDALPSQMRSQIQSLLEEIASLSVERSNWQKVAHENDLRLTAMISASKLHTEKITQLELKCTQTQSHALELEDQLEKLRISSNETTEKHKKTVEALETRLGSVPQLESQLESTRNDLKNVQSQLELAYASRDVELREHSKHVDAKRMLVETKDALEIQLEESRLTISAIETAKMQLETQCETLRNEITELRTENETIRSENESLLNRLQFSLLEEHSDVPIDKVLERIRREKEKALAKVEHLEVQLKRSDLELQRVREKEVSHSQRLAELIQQRFSTEQSDGQSDVSTVQLLRENNMNLRKDIKSRDESISELNAQLNELQDSVEPLEKSKRVLENTVKTLESEKVTLESEIQHWQKRSSVLLARYNHVDPTEHLEQSQELEKVKKQLESVRTELENTQQQLKNAYDQVNRLKKKVSSEALSVKEKVFQLEKSNSGLEAANKVLGERLMGLLQCLEKGRLAFQRIRSSGTPKHVVDNLKNRLEELGKQVISLQREKDVRQVEFEALQSEIMRKDEDKKRPVDVDVESQTAKRPKVVEEEEEPEEEEIVEEKSEEVELPPKRRFNLRRQPLPPAVPDKSDEDSDNSE